MHIHTLTQIHVHVHTHVHVHVRVRVRVRVRVGGRGKGGRRVVVGGSVGMCRWSSTASSGKANDWRTRERVVLDLFSNLEWVRSKGFFR